MGIAKNFKELVWVAKSPIILCLLFCLCIYGCETETSEADTIFYNGKIISMDKDFRMAEAVAIKDGKFLKIGENKDVLSLAGDSTIVIDLKQHTLIPGLIEGHAHTVAASQSEYFEKIPDIETLEELLDWVADQAKIKENEEWIVHPKFFFTRLREMRLPTKKELDNAAPNNPVFLNGSYGGMLNSKAIQLANLDTSNHKGILKDEGTGELSGMIRSSAFGLLPYGKEEISAYTDKLEALKNMLHLYNKAGITSVNIGRSNNEELKLFEDLLTKNELSVRVYLNMSFPGNLNSSVQEMENSISKMGYKTGDGNEWIKFGALKAVIDGGVLTGTAFLRKPWGIKAKEIFGIQDPEYRGELFLGKKDLVKLITTADASGWNFTAHVTGGGGVDTLIAAFEEVNLTIPIREKRFSIIHGNFFDKESIEKMSKLGIYANMQPAWFFLDADLLNEVLGAERMQDFHPYQSMVDAGIPIVGGSDHMVKLDWNKAINPYNPFLSMWALISRKTEKGNVYGIDESVSRRSALEMYTINNAYASFEEDLKGSIEAGKLADLVILSTDILTCSEEEIKNIQPLLTMLGGKIVYDSGKLLD